MTIGLYCYVICWVLFCILNIYFLVSDAKSFTICSVNYFLFLVRPWKMITFLMAMLGIVAIAPYTEDPTWDYINASFMSVLTFITAPWSIGIIYKSLKSKSLSKSFFLAVCFWMFSASWSYDLYLLIRDRYYPITWFPNIFASSVLYISAGLLWNLDWRVERGVTFSFLEEDWFFIEKASNFGKIFWVGLPFMVIAFCAIIFFIF